MGALVDHEERITANEATLVDHEERITTNETNIAANTAAIATEQAARIAADEALATRISGLENTVAELDDKISSSTATAIALGGIGFLPDTKFNLAGNVGFYEGAQAIAISAGVRVSENVAITGGIGGGLNKGGKIGGRVGFIFGW